MDCRSLVPRSSKWPPRVRLEIAREECGATAIEYGLLAGLVAVAIIVGVATLGGNLESLYEFVEANTVLTNALP